MNPDYLWFAGAIELLTLFVIGPALAIAIAYAAWGGNPLNFGPKHYGIVCVAYGVGAFLLFVLAKLMHADIRTSLYFLQLACVLLAGLLFGVCMGCGFPVLLSFWRWHKATRLGER